MSHFRIRPTSSTGNAKGLDNGSEFRKHLNLDTLDKDNEQYTIVIPREIIVLSFPYFDGLFRSSIISLGIDGFRKKYQFRCTKEKENWVNLFISRLAETYNTSATLH